MKIELIGIPSEANCEINKVQISGMCSNGIRDGCVYGKFEIPIPHVMANEIRKLTSPHPPKLKITVETIE